MSPCLARRRERTRSHDISMRSVRQSTRALRDRYDLCSSHFRRRVVAIFFNSLKSHRYSATSYELRQYEERCVRQPTTYGEFSTRCGEFITRGKS